MKFSKKAVKRETPKVIPKAEDPKKLEMIFAINKLALFTERRQDIAWVNTPERLKECDFWIAHFKKVIAGLEKK